jgi:hypothetical protein
MIGFPRARLIFEKQSRLLSFLAKTVQMLFGDAVANEPSSSLKWKEMMRNGLRKSGDTAHWSNFTHQPFSAPPVFSVENLLSKTKARLEGTKDHLWLLQTEPEYLRRYIFVLGDMHSAANDRTSLGPRLIAGEIAGDMDALWF